MNPVTESLAELVDTIKELLFAPIEWARRLNRGSLRTLLRIMAACLPYYISLGAFYGMTHFGTEYVDLLLKDLHQSRSFWFAMSLVAFMSSTIYYCRQAAYSALYGDWDRNVRQRPPWRCSINFHQFLVVLFFLLMLAHVVGLMKDDVIARPSLGAIFQASFIVVLALIPVLAMLRSRRAMSRRAIRGFLLRPNRSGPLQKRIQLYSIGTGLVCLAAYVLFAVIFLFPQRTFISICQAAELSILQLYFVLLNMVFRTLQLIDKSPLSRGLRLKYGLGFREACWILGAALLLAFPRFKGSDNRSMTVSRAFAADPLSAPSDRLTVPEALSLFTQGMPLGPGGKKKIIVVACEGGGIHAAFRASTALAELEHMEPDFWRHVFVVSGVSGGSVGSSTAYIVSETRRRLKLREDIRQLTSKVASSNYLSICLGRLLFTDLLGFFFPSIENADKGKGLEESYLQAFEALDDRASVEAKAIARTPLIHGAHRPSEPYFCFNTTMASSGRRMVLSRLKLRTINSSANLIDPDDPLFYAAACASARFPGFPGPAKYRIGRSGNSSRLVYLLDGGLYENSGLTTALNVIDEIRQDEANRDVKNPVEILLVVIGNNYQKSRGPVISEAKVPGDVAEYGPFVLDRQLTSAESMLWLQGVVGNVFSRNSEIGNRLKIEADRRKTMIAYLPWCGTSLNAPLGWFMYSERNKAVAWNLGAASFFAQDGKEQTFDTKWLETMGVLTKDCPDCGAYGVPKEVTWSRFLNFEPGKQLAMVRTQNVTQLNRIAHFGTGDEVWKKEESDKSKPTAQIVKAAE
ncbi:MAG: patatin-like phospholipase family protein [Armatimonadetes bacterium]|nr:patatin-like phospholipase family protein [Armatimonadota bacterium]